MTHVGLRHRLFSRLHLPRRSYSSRIAADYARQSRQARREQAPELRRARKNVRAYNRYQKRVVKNLMRPVADTSNIDWTRVN
jgi:hypothetical protein